MCSVLEHKIHSTFILSTSNVPSNILEKQPEKNPEVHYLSSQPIKRIYSIKMKSVVAWGQMI